MVDKDTVEKEMEVLLAEKEIKVNDKTVVVKRFSFLDAIRLASHTSAIIAEVINDSEKTAGAVTRLMFNSGNEKEDNVIRITGFVELLSIVGDEGVELLKEIMVKSTNMDEEEIENVDSVEGIDLAFAVYEVNRGFFMKCMNKLKKAIPNMKPKKKATKKEK